MCSSNSFDILLGYGSVAGVVCLDWYELDSHHMNRAELASAGLLRKASIGKTIRCRGCGDFIHAFPRGDRNGIKLYGDCPECGLYELLEEETVLWRIDYRPILEAAYEKLCCSGGITEILPDTLWALGRAPVGGQSCGIFACAGINTDCNNAAIIQHLPTGKSPVLLVLGEDPRPEKLGSFFPDRVFNFSHLTSLENGRIIFAPEHIQKQMSLPVSRAEIMKKVLGRNSVIGDAIIKMKTELREFMRGVYSDFEQAEKSGREPVFEGIRQNQLAVLAGVTPVIVTRALKRDMELKALFDAANNPRTAYTYGSKARR